MAQPHLYQLRQPWWFSLPTPSIPLVSSSPPMTPTLPVQSHHTWKPVTVDEMKGFIGTVLNMGILQLPNLKDYCAKDNTTNLPFFCLIFPRNRFFQIIFGTLHACDIDSTIRRQKIQPLLDLFCPQFESAYTPGQHTAINESVISFWERVGFLQYLKGKPKPWGIKAFVLADIISGYLYKVRIDFDKDTQLVQPDLPHTTRVVLTLFEGLHDKGYDLYVDRFYASPLLATHLSKFGITLTGNITLGYCLPVR